MFEEGKWTWENDGVQVVRSTARTCPGCHEGCGVLLYFKDGRLTKVEGNPDFQFSQGRLCPGCLALPEVVYHPDRLKHPLKRVGKIGEGKWEKITWEDALDEISNKLNKFRNEFGVESAFFAAGPKEILILTLVGLRLPLGVPIKFLLGLCWVMPV